LTIEREEVETCEVYPHKHLFLLLLRGGGRGGGGRCQVFPHKQKCMHVPEALSY